MVQVSRQAMSEFLSSRLDVKMQYLASARATKATTTRDALHRRSYPHSSTSALTIAGEICFVRANGRKITPLTLLKLVFRLNVS